MYRPNLLRPLAVFLSVAEHCSFRRAAEDLGISAPLTSQIIAGLEESLGRQLIYRSTRKITLTDAGASLAAELHGSFVAIDDAIEAFSPLSRPPKGRLRVTVPTVLAEPAFSRFVHSYAKANPDLRLEIDVSDEFRDPIQTGDDLAIRIGTADERDRVRRHLFQSEGIVCAGPPGRDWTIGDLEEQLFVRPPNVPGQLMLRKGEAIQQITPRQTLIVNNGRMVRDILKSGGFGVFPAFTVQEAITTGQLVRVGPDWSLGPLDVVALYTARRARLSIARDFVEKLTHFIGQI